MNIYCVYLTIYRGNKLRMFYIGSTSISKLNSGYRGSVLSKKYKETWNAELSANPHLFETKIISYHDTREHAFDKEETLQRLLKVVPSEMYVNESYANGGFSMAGKSLSDEHKQKLSKIMKSDEMKSKLSPNLGKSPSQETVEKLRIACSGKIASAAARDKMRKAWETREPTSNESKAKMSTSNKKSQPITINGVTYRSKRHAAQELGIDRKSI